MPRAAGRTTLRAHPPTAQTNKNGRGPTPNRQPPAVREGTSPASSPTSPFPHPRPPSSISRTPSNSPVRWWDAARATKKPSAPSSPRPAAKANQPLMRRGHGAVSGFGTRARTLPFTGTDCAFGTHRANPPPSAPSRSGRDCPTSLRLPSARPLAASFGATQSPAPPPRRSAL